MIMPNPKIVFMVRDFRAIYSSMEKLFRKNPDIDPKIMNNIDMTGITTDQRVEIWGNTHPVGFTITKLHQSILDGTAQNFLFFKYEDFCQFPDEHMKKMYKFLVFPNLNLLNFSLAFLIDSSKSRLEEPPQGLFPPEPHGLLLLFQFISSC